MGPHNALDRTESAMSTGAPEGEGFPLTGAQLQVSLLREQVTDLLREAIVSLRLKPGQRLVERELVEWTGVSRGTVRESLRELTAEGLVTTIPQKGAVVAAPTRKKAEELYEIRSMLEGLAARQFVERASEEDMLALRRAYEGLRAVAERAGTTSEMLEAKKHVYTALFNGAANSTIEDILNGLQARITVLRAASMSQPGRMKASVDEIRELVEAVEARDAARAEQVCADHVRTAGRIVLSLLEEPATATTAPTEQPPQPVTGDGDSRAVPA